MKLSPTSLRTYLTALLAVASPSSVLAAEVATQAVQGDTSQLLVYEPELQVQYGKYSEATIALGNAENRTVEWSILGSNVPPGFSIYDTNSSSLILYGTPTFTGTWCTVYVAKAAATAGKEELRGMQEICFASKEDDSFRAPKFDRVDRYLEAKVPNVSFNETFQVSTSSGSVSGDLYESALPADSANVNFSNGRFNLSGKVANTGAYSFALRAVSSDGQEMHRQYVLLIEEAQEATTCPAGYYYDLALGYCVAANQEKACPSGTYYDPEANNCVQYPAPPPTIVCSPGYYFDPFLSNCVPAYAERCPLNYSYDVYEGRCVRQPYTCSYNERYDYFYKDCIRIYRNTCSYGYHWDFFRDRCVRNYQACYSGFYYSSTYDRCMPVSYRCGYDEVYDPRYGGCRMIRTSTYCSAGTRYDYSLNRCVSVYANYPSYCSYGNRYDPVYRRCVSYNPRPVPIPHRPRPIPVPHHRPRPIPGGPTIPRPGNPSCPPGTTYNGRIGRCGSPSTGPQRPTGPGRPTPQGPQRPTGPTRPTTPTRPTQPQGPQRPTGPTRPTTPTRPTQPQGPQRPGGPTRPTTPTRPTQPQGPRRPTTPTRPTERPAPPSRPTERPTPPSRPTGGYERPTERPTPPSRPVERPAPPSRPSGGYERPAERPAPPSRPVERPAPPSRPVERPAPPSRPSGGYERPSPPSRPAERPSPPSRPSGGYDRPSPPSRPSGGGGGGSPRPSGGGGQRPSRPGRG